MQLIGIIIGIAFMFIALIMTAQDELDGLYDRLDEIDEE